MLKAAPSAFVAEQLCTSLGDVIVRSGNKGSGKVRFDCFSRIVLGDDSLAIRERIGDSRHCLVARKKLVNTENNLGTCYQIVALSTVYAENMARHEAPLL